MRPLWPVRRHSDVTGDGHAKICTFGQFYRKILLIVINIFFNRKGLLWTHCISKHYKKLINKYVWLTEGTAIRLFEWIFKAHTVFTVIPCKIVLEEMPNYWLFLTKINCILLLLILKLKNMNNLLILFIIKVVISSSFIL